MRIDSGWRTAAVGAGVVCVAFALLLWGGRVLLRHCVVSRMSPGERTQVHKFLHEPFRVPDAWKDAKPFAPELVGALGDLTSAWEARPKQLEYVLASTSHMIPFQYPVMVPLYHGTGSFDRGYLIRLQAGDPLTMDDWTTISEGLTSAGAIMARASLLARRPDYQFDLTSSCSPPLYPSNGGFSMRHSAFRFLLLNAHANARTGQWKRSFESVALDLVSGGPGTHRRPRQCQRHCDAGAAG